MSPATKKKVYVVQEHHASTHHFDFRLEKEGVLKSWAVPKGVPLENGVKRLAVETEDHIMSYARFEGSIEEGLYGAGTVKIWDEGLFQEIEWSEDKIIVQIEGRKVTGTYILIRTAMGKNSGGQGKNWLIFRKEDRR